MTNYDPRNKRIGRYLVDAGLVTTDQIRVALADQRNSNQRLGDILVTRGWIKKQTLEYVMGKVVNLERSLGKPLSKSLFEKAMHARGKRRKGAL